MDEAIHRANCLNILPVIPPINETGTNIVEALDAVNELEKQDDEHIGNVAKLVSSALLRGARGNSGVILSLIFRGFAKGLADISQASGRDLVRSLGIGVESAYSAVMKPTEGTMLTVMREGAKQTLDKLIDHYTYVLVGDGDLQEGICYESMSLAGKLKLNKLIVLHDSNDFQLDSSVSAVNIENLRERVESQG